MKKEWYDFANRLTLSDKDIREVMNNEQLDALTQNQYKRSILTAIRKEQQKPCSKSLVHTRHWGIAAACLILLGVPSLVFHEEVHAAITHISYSLRDALGLEGDISQYTELVNTPVSDKGYVVTLQEAAAIPQKLIISYTVQREDGQPLPDTFNLDSTLYVNGSPIHGGATGSAGFLDKDNKILGVQLSYDVADIDLAAENTYEINFTAFNTSTAEDDIGGNWNFKFKAGGTELFADTRSMNPGNTFAMADGEVITLDTFTDNPLEQQITYTISNAGGNYFLLKLTATDEQGRTAVFSVSRSSGTEGCLSNEKLVENGRIPADAKTVTVTLYVQELPEESGKEPNDYTQIGEPVTWDMTDLQ